MLSRLALRNAACRLPALARSQSSAAVSTEGVKRGIPRPIDPSPVRYGFIPEEWFTIFYNKTGVTGPYMFTAAVTTWLVSKELYVLEHEFFSLIPVIIVSVGLVKKVGPSVAKYCDENMDREEKELEDSRTDMIDGYTNAIEAEKREQWRTDGQMMIMDAMKINIAMQLEASYRERAFNVYSEVKKRLDYQLQIANVERRIAQKHMTQWIINNVIKSITPDQEKAALQQCISELQALAPRA